LAALRNSVLGRSRGAASKHGPPPGPPSMTRLSTKRSKIL